MGQVLPGQHLRGVSSSPGSPSVWGEEGRAGFTEETARFQKSRFKTRSHLFIRDATQDLRQLELAPTKVSGWYELDHLDQLNESKVVHGVCSDNTGSRHLMESTSTLQVRGSRAKH